MHGSEIARDVLDRTEGALRLWPATLYRTLDDLAEAGFIEELIEEQRPGGAGGRERFYRATPEGRVALAEEATRLARHASTARRRLEGA